MTYSSPEIINYMDILFKGYSNNDTQADLSDYLVKEFRRLKKEGYSRQLFFKGLKNQLEILDKYRMNAIWKERQEQEHVRRLLKENGKDYSIVDERLKELQNEDFYPAPSFYSIPEVPSYVNGHLYSRVYRHIEHHINLAEKITNRDSLSKKLKKSEKVLDRKIKIEELSFNKGKTIKIKKEVEVVPFADWFNKNGEAIEKAIAIHWFLNGLYLIKKIQWSEFLFYCHSKKLLKENPNHVDLATSINTRFSQELNKQNLNTLTQFKKGKKPNFKKYDFSFINELA